MGESSGESTPPEAKTFNYPRSILDLQVNGFFSVGGRINESVQRRIEIVHRQVRRRWKEISVAAGNRDRVCGGNQMRPGNGAILDRILKGHIDETVRSENSCTDDAGRERVAHGLASPQRR